MCSVHENNFINIPFLIPAFCPLPAGLDGKILGGMNLGVSFLQESQAVLDIPLLDNGSLWRALSQQPRRGWRVSASEGEHPERDPFTARCGPVGYAQGSAAVPTSLLGRSNVEVWEEGRAGSSSK